MTLSNTTGAKFGRYSAPVAESEAELEAMREGMGELIDLLSYARPHGSDTELLFLKDWLLPRLRKAGCDPQIDGFGNIWATVSKQVNCGPDFLWSCHVDTVHKACGRQGVKWLADGQTLGLTKKKPGKCLGADDGAGVWLLLQMIRAGVPGGYVFHRGEEAGRLGSLYVETKEPERLKGFDACVAFDRRDFTDCITHQMGERCASENFADTFSGSLNRAGCGLRYMADDTGSYTDSYTYAGMISECANMSVGYDREHGPNETLDCLHLWRLKEAICAADFSRVVCERDPSVVEFDGWGSWGGSYGGSRTGAASWGASGSWASGGSEGAGPWDDSDLALDPDEALLELVRRYPRAVADLLDLYGLGVQDVLEHVPTGELGAAMAVTGGGWNHD